MTKLDTFINNISKSLIKDTYNKRELLNLINTLNEKKDLISSLTRHEEALIKQLELRKTLNSYIEISYRLNEHSNKSTLVSKLKRSDRKLQELFLKVD